MTRSFAAAMRRANRLMRPAKPTRKAKSIQTAMTNLMVKSALAPFAALKPAKKTRARKPAPAKASGPVGVMLTQMRAAQALMPGRGLRPARPPVAPRIPAGAQYLDQLYRGVAGSRRYKLYLPASQPKRPKGLIVMLHGCNQTPDDFAVGTHMNALAEKHGLAVAYPAQTRGQNAASCWNWFKPGNQGRGTGEPAILAGLTGKLAKTFGLRRDAVFVAGLSAGGAMAAILADVYPDVFSAVGIHSGLTRGAAHDVRSAVLAMRRGTASGGSASDGRLPDSTIHANPVRRIVFQGDRDSTVHPSNMAQIVAAAVGPAAQPGKVTHRTVRGRDYDRSDYVDAAGVVRLEIWMIKGAGHAWSGGRVAGSYTDKQGPDASAQMIRFFLSKSG